MANGRNPKPKRPHLTGAKTASFYVDASGIDGIAGYLEQLGETVQEAIRPVAYAGAKVIYDRVLMNVAGIGIKTGNLRSAVYHAYAKEASTPGKREMYRISWNVTKAPHGRLLEWGWVQRYAAYMGKNGKYAGNWYTDKSKPLDTPIQHPGLAFIRRAHAALPEAQEAMRQELEKRLAALQKDGA